MPKIRNIIQENAPLILVIIATLVITMIIIFKPAIASKKTETESYNLTNFNIVTTKETIKLFSEIKPQILIICRSTCSVCQSFIPTLNTINETYNIKMNYLDLELMDLDSKETKELKELLNYEYTLQEKTAPYSDFLGTTPMFIIIKNKEMVYGYIGSMDSSVVQVLLENYEVI